MSKVSQVSKTNTKAYTGYLCDLMNALITHVMLRIIVVTITVNRINKDMITVKLVIIKSAKE